ncbi:hypothetical protein ASC84_10845 [Acinetobacter sp. Root1280]|nr:hypothetical protein ASC84_10845 [Acinetobacter sp. Root1280]
MPVSTKCYIYQYIGLELKNKKITLITFILYKNSFYKIKNHPFKFSLSLIIFKKNTKKIVHQNTILAL